MRTNCPNCGAPIEPGAARCPYCRTPYETTQAVLTIDANGLTLSTMSTQVEENTTQRLLGIRSPSAALGKQMAAGFSTGMEDTHARLLEYGTRYWADYHATVQTMSASGFTFEPRPDGGMSMAFSAPPKKPRGLLGRLWRRIKRKD